MYRFIFIVASVLVIGDGKKLPSYIKPCRKDDPKIVECAIRHGQDALPQILKGDKEYKFPPLAPLYIPEITLQAREDITLKMKDVHLKGLETAVILSGIVDLKKMRIGGKISLKYITIESQLDIDGRVLIVPIKGTGPATVNFENVIVEFIFGFELVKKEDGKEYIDNLSPHVSYTVEKIHFELENLFNGDKNLGNSTNQFLNEHAKELNEDFESSIADTIKVLVTAMLKAVTQTVPYEEVFI